MCGLAGFVGEGDWDCLVAMTRALVHRGPDDEGFDVVAFCQRLPHGYKLRNGQRKYLLKRAMAGLLPAEVLGRRKKGFGIPLARWLREVPAEPPLAPVPGMREAWMADRWRGLRAGREDERLLLWSWLSLQESIAPVARTA